MTIEERIVALEAEAQRANQQINEWTAVRLRAEGALHVLRQMVEESKQESAKISTEE